MAQVTPGLKSIGEAIVTSPDITTGNVVFNTLLTIDGDSSCCRNVVGRRMRWQGKVVETSMPGVYSHTSASQADLPHVNNREIRAFRCYYRDRRLIVA